MDLKKGLFYCILWVSFSFMAVLNAQITPGTYFSTTENARHELKFTQNYMVHTVYSSNPVAFIKTLGGHYVSDNGHLMAKLEFNSNFAADGLKNLSVPFKMDNGKLTLQGENTLVFEPLEKMPQDLDGLWLFATRGPDEGQERRGDENPRKTLKFLIDGRFQWIAYHTETFDFSGTGGGTYTAKDGVYTEQIEYFSRDNTRVGALLNFNYVVKGADWHHTGKNSKGEALYEIWAKR